MPVSTILGLRVDNLTLRETVEEILQTFQEGSPHLLQVVTLNPEMVVRAQQEPMFANIINGAGLVVPDGIGVVWGLKQLGNPVKGRVPGVEVVENLLVQGPKFLKRRLRVFLLGAAADVVAEAAEEIGQHYPGVEIVGFHDGYFTPAEEGQIIDRIAEGQPDLLLVGLGSPYQEQWIDYHYQRLASTVAIGVGGSIDVLAGRVSRAPELWRRVGLEWFYRLLKNPTRLGRMLALPKFVLLVLKDKAFFRS